MVRFQSGKEDIVDELRFLRKGEGFTPMRYIDLIVLPDLLGGRERNFHLTKAFFVEAIQALPGKQLQESLLVAFGLAQGYTDFDTICERRKKYGQQIGRKYDTLRHREDIALEQLASILLKGKRYGAW